jgi:3-hydroxybutyrate dehydrogenase
MSHSIGGKTAIVTGAGSGINLAFADQLLGGGCNVLFADLALRPEAQKLLDAHSGAVEGKGRAAFQQTDVTDWKHLERMFGRAEEEFGEIDIVCPGAGVYEPVCALGLGNRLPLTQRFARVLAASGIPLEPHRARMVSTEDAT